VGLDFVAFVERWSCHGEVEKGRAHGSGHHRHGHIYLG
jgi:hypothetical protein